MDRREALRTLGGVAAGLTGVAAFKPPGRGKPDRPPGKPPKPTTTTTPVTTTSTTAVTVPDAPVLRVL